MVYMVYTQQKSVSVYDDGGIYALLLLTLSISAVTEFRPLPSSSILHIKYTMMLNKHFSAI